MDQRGNEPEERPRPLLDYDRADRRPGVAAPVFWAVYAISLGLGVFVLRPFVDRALFGHPGDSGVACICAASVVVVTASLGLLHARLLKRMPWLFVLALAAGCGTFAFMPAYVVMLLFF
jgi:hypothetical protein